MVRRTSLLLVLWLVSPSVSQEYRVLVERIGDAADAQAGQGVGVVQRISRDGTRVVYPSEDGTPVSNWNALKKAVEDLVDYDTIVLDSSAVYQGDGLIVSDNKSVRWLNGRFIPNGRYDWILEFRNCDDLEFKSLQFDGLGTHQESEAPEAGIENVGTTNKGTGDLFKLRGCDRVLVSGLSCRGSTSNELVSQVGITHLNTQCDAVEIDDCANVLLTNLHIADAGYSGVRIRGSNDTVKINGGIFQDCWWHAVVIGGTNDDVLINNCAFIRSKPTDMGFVGDLDMNGDSFRHFTLSNCTWRYNYDWKFWDQPEWKEGQSVDIGDVRISKSKNRMYLATTSGITGSTEPTHTGRDPMPDGNVEWKWMHNFFATHTLKLGAGTLTGDTMTLRNCRFQLGEQTFLADAFDLPRRSIRFQPGAQKFGLVVIDGCIIDGNLYGVGAHSIRRLVVRNSQIGAGAIDKVPRECLAFVNADQIECYGTQFAYSLQCLTHDNFHETRKLVFQDCTFKPMGTASKVVRGVDIAGHGTVMTTFINNTLDRSNDLVAQWSDSVEGMVRLFGPCVKELQESSATVFVEVDVPAARSVIGNAGTAGGIVEFTIIAWDDESSDRLQTQSGSFPFTCVNENGTIGARIGDVVVVEEVDDGSLEASFDMVSSNANAFRLRCNAKASLNQDKLWLQYRVRGTGISTVTPQ